jgi:predicted exporter
MEKYFFTTKLGTLRQGDYSSLRRVISGGTQSRRQAAKNPHGQRRRALRNCQSTATQYKRSRSAAVTAPIGVIHESANCSPSRQEFQSISVCRYFDYADTHDSCSLGLVFGGCFARAPANSFAVSFNSGPDWAPEVVVCGPVQL